MRNVDIKWKSPIHAHSVRNFSHNDIRELIVEEKYPQLTIYPFYKLPNSPIRHLPVVISIRHTLSDQFKGKDIIPCIISIGKQLTTSFDMGELSFSVFFLIYVEYILQVARWQEYFYKELQAFCESSESVAYWNAFQHTQNAPIKNREKATWVTICKHADREFWTKFAISIRESLLPWMNIELYKKMKDSEENKRTNVDYEKQKLAMSEGRLKDVDVSFRDPEDEIDIIE